MRQNKLAALISLEDAVALSLDNTRAMGTEYRRLSDSLRGVIADNVISPIDIPGFDRSAMDGYVISRADLERLKNEIPLTLTVTDTIQAGSTVNRELKTGETFRIMTGAWLPEGSAAVIKQEDVLAEEKRIVIDRSLKPGENIRSAGHELKAGGIAAVKGQVLMAETLERIAACGLDEILVHKQPQISVIDTGNELRLPGSPLRRGQIFGSNRYLLAGKIAAAGAVPLLADSIIKDELPSIVRSIKEAALTADMIIISGGTGDGDFDLVYKALEQLEGKTLFKGINIIPGQGTSATLFQGKLVFNLSGNPHAAGLLFEALIMPALQKLKGNLFSDQKWFDLQLGSPIKKIKAGRSLHRGEMVIQDGSVYAQPLGKESNPPGNNLPIILDIPGGLGVVGDTVKAKLIIG